MRVSPPTRGLAIHGAMSVIERERESPLAMHGALCVVRSN